MFQSLALFKTSMAMAQHAGRMQVLSAQNIANADTPKYVARDLPSFESMIGRSSNGMRATRDEHLVNAFSSRTGPEKRSKPVDPNGNSVSLETELVHAIDAKR